MQVKVFEAEDMASGLRQVRRELGPDALILSTRTIKNGKLGLLGKQHLEITAAIDSKWPEEKSSRPSAERSRASRLYKESDRTENSPPPHRSPPAAIEPSHIPEKPQVPQMAQMPPAPSEDLASRQEFDELRNMVKTLAGEISRLGSQPPPARGATEPPAQSLEMKLRAHRPASPIEDILLARGIDSDTSKIISNFVGDGLERADLLDEQKIYSFLHTTLEDILTVNTPDFNAMNGRQKRMALIGPTGVGKTTTLAKIAAKYLAEQSNSIAFITVDTYRIAAVEQLKVYGEIMHLPVEVVITPQQLAEALEKHQDKELILIDTAGRSPLDSLGIEEIQSYFTPELEIENYLVLSATTRDNELMKIFAQFEQVPVQGTIFTKIDECSTLGVLLNMQVHTGKPLSYLTNGQRVPEDILEADKQQVAHLIIPFAGGIVHE